MRSVDRYWVLLFVTWNSWSCAGAIRVESPTEPLLERLNLPLRCGTSCKFYLLIASPCFVLVFSFLRIPLKRGPEALLGNMKCTVAIPLPQ